MITPVRVAREQADGALPGIHDNVEVAVIS